MTEQSRRFEKQARESGQPPKPGRRPAETQCQFCDFVQTVQVYPVGEKWHSKPSTCSRCGEPLTGEATFTTVLEQLDEGEDDEEPVQLSQRGLQPCVVCGTLSFQRWCSNGCFRAEDWGYDDPL